MAAVALLTAWACGGAAGTAGSTPPQDGEPLRLTTVVTGLRSPVHVAAPAGDARVFVVEQEGTIRIVRDGRIESVPFLDLRDRVRSGGERGLLSVAFHPAYAQNGFLYVNYTDSAGATRVERYSVSPDPDRADPGSAKLMLRVPQPFSNHNGGHVLFGPDGMLYIAMGDGGSGGDPQGNARNRANLLGAILRIDVDAGDPYAIPADNPYAGSDAFRREIWAYGVRNPWRIAFDAPSGLLYVADVGQNRVEEINVVPADVGGLNFGWNVLEGSECFSSATCDAAGMVLPEVEYDHSQGCSVIGGTVYRGTALDTLRGTYFYSDYCEGWLRSFRFAEGRATESTQWPVGRLGKVTSFGTDGLGELYVVTAEGTLYRLDPGT